MTLKKLIFDEMIDAKELYEKGFDGEFTYRKVRLVCIYMHLELGYGADRIKTEIIKFCKKQDPFFNPIVKETRKKLNEIISGAMKIVEYKRTECPIIIHQSEIDVIRKVKNFKHQKLLLAMLFVVKSSRGTVLRESLFPYIREMLTIRDGLPNQQLLNLIPDFISLGLLKDATSDKYVHTWNLTFMVDSGTSLFTLYNDTQARSLISMYVKLCGGELGYCRVCDEEFIKTGTRELYCSTHKISMRQKYRRDYKTKGVLL
jgi:hypothetical protein